MLTIIAANSTLSEQCPEIGQKCQEIGHFLPGAFPPRRVLPIDIYISGLPAPMIFDWRIALSIESRES